jgi:hypothetical protein
MFSTSSIQHQAETAGSTNFGGTLYIFQTDPTHWAAATVLFGTVGDIAGQGGGYFESVITNTLSGTNWYVPTTFGIGSSYYIRATLSSGSTPSGSLGTWSALTSDAVWTINASGAGALAECELFIEISSNSGGSPVVASGNVNLTAQINTYGGGGGQLP